MRKQNCTYCEYRLCDGCWVNKVLGIIDEQTTAYDVEEKIKQLKAVKKDHKNTNTIFDLNKYVLLDDAINIVKGGDCDDEHTQEEFEFGNEPYCDDDGNNL